MPHGTWARLKLDCPPTTTGTTVVSADLARIGQEVTRLRAQVATAGRAAPV